MAVYTKLAQGNRAGLKDVEGYEMPTKAGAIVYLTQTLMTWGDVHIKKNVPSQRNKLRECGYLEMTPAEVIGHDGPITGGTKEPTQ